MARKPSGKAGELFGKPSGSPAPVPASSDKPIEFRADGNEAWRCERPDRIAATLSGFQPSAESLPRLLDLVRPHPQLWSYVRKVWGIIPMFPKPDEPEENLRVWSEMEAYGALGLSRDGVASLVDTLRGLWMAKERATQAPVTMAPKPDAKPAVELDLEGEKTIAVIRELGLTGIHFENHDEELWFQQRVSELRKILEVSGTKMLGKQLLLTEFELRRADLKTFRGSMSKEDAREARQHRKEVHDKFLELTQQIEKVAPWFFSVGGINFRNCLSELISGYQEFNLSDDSRLLDGIFTATEIRVMHRHSAQSLDSSMSPAPIQYRAGLVAHLNAARAGIFQLGWRSGIPDQELARVDRAYHAAIAAIIKESGAEIPDLLRGGEYPMINEDSPNTQRDHGGQPEGVGRGQRRPVSGA